MKDSRGRLYVNCVMTNFYEPSSSNYILADHEFHAGEKVFDDYRTLRYRGLAYKELRDITSACSYWLEVDTNNRIQGVSRNNLDLITDIQCNQISARAS